MCERAAFSHEMNHHHADSSSWRTVRPPNEAFSCQALPKCREECLPITSSRALVERALTPTLCVDGGKQCLLGLGKIEQFARSSLQGDEPEHPLSVLLGRTECEIRIREHS